LPPLDVAGFDQMTVAEGRPAEVAEMTRPARAEALADVRAAARAMPEPRAESPETVFAGSTKLAPSLPANALPDAPYAFSAAAGTVADVRKIAANQKAIAGALEEAAAAWGQLRAAVARGAVALATRVPYLSSSGRKIGPV
jgi:hypothetical protein